MRRKDKFDSVKLHFKKNKPEPKKQFIDTPIEQFTGYAEFLNDTSFIGPTS